jgi:hypothetical protein
MHGGDEYICWRKTKSKRIYGGADTGWSADILERILSPHRDPQRPKGGLGGKHSLLLKLVNGMFVETITSFMPSS